MTRAGKPSGTEPEAFRLAESWHGMQWALASSLHQRLGRFEGTVHDFVSTAAELIRDSLADGAMLVLVDLPDHAVPVHSYVDANAARRSLMADVVDELGDDELRNWVADVTSSSRRFSRISGPHESAKRYVTVIQRHLDELGITEAVYAAVRHLDGRTRGLVVCTRDPGREAFTAVDLMSLGGAADSISILLDTYLARQAEAATDRYWATSFETGPFGKIVLDADRTYLRISGGACEILGVDRWDILGQKWPALSQQSDLEEDLSDLERARRGLHVPDRLRLVRRPSGETRWIQRSIAAVFDAAGDVELFHVQFADVTALREAQAGVSALAEQRRVLLTQLVSAEQAERHRIAQDVHDDSIQLLAAAQLRMQLLVNQLVEADDGRLHEARTAADIVSGLLTTAQRRLRQLLLDLEPPSAPGRSLDQALQQVADGFFGGTETDVRVTGTLDDVPEEVASVFYRAAREALSNALRHADATAITVTLASDEGRWTVTVIDDGVGVPDVVQSAPGLGLRGMHNRVEALGGTCSVRPHAAGGTEVVLSVPRG